MQKTTFVFILFALFSLVMGDRLLYEPNAPDYRATQDQPQSLFDKLAPDTTLSTFMDVLTQIDDIFKLVNDSTSRNEFTIFCPTNSAFRNELDIYTREHLDEFLRNHVVPTHKINVESLKKTQSLSTMLRGEPIQVRYHTLSQRTVLNEHAQVDTQHYVEAINGIAYKINHLLRPYQ